MGHTVRDRLVVTNDTKYLIVVRDFVGRMIRQSRVTREEENKIILAVDEAVTNIIEHGYEPGVEGLIELEVEADEAQFKVVIRDSGRVFNPESVPNLDMGKHVRAGRRKGLGIFLMRQIMDEVRYRFKDGVKNELTLVKYSK
ncbi:MAG: ATP-binding protein [Planctomycetes bacterium]|nr:ATP-binding protein [Planctomycetota bacterium]